MTESAVWVTGADGFVGKWVLQALAKRQIPAAALLIPGASLDKKIPQLSFDLRHASLQAEDAEVLDLHALPEPRALIHLAALSFPPQCEEQPDLARQVHALGPARMYKQILGTWPDLPILHISSGQIYGSQAGVVAESASISPQNVYGATKLEGEAVALGLRDRGHAISVVRPFNHAGPGQMPSFALPSFALRIAQMVDTGGGILEVGNLDGVRDFLHVRQVAETYLDLLVHTDSFDIVNVGSGQGQVMAAMLDQLIQAFGVPVEIRTQDHRLRGNQDANRLVADVTRLQSLLGKSPRLDLKNLVAEITKDALSRIAAGEDLSLA